MKVTVSTDFVMRLLQATPGQQAVVDRLLQATPEQQALIERVLNGGKAESGNREERFVFCRLGSQWRVVFEGGEAFYLPDTLGARYLDFLLHRPNAAISAFDLEREIRPEKARARSRTSIQKTLDEAGVRAKLRELDGLRAEREEAQEAGDEGLASRLDRLIEAGESELEGEEPGDTGEMARCNVSQAVGAVRRRLEKGNRKERAFAEHLKESLSLGYECMYIQAEGRIWR